MPPAASPLRLLHLVGSAVDDFHADLSRLYAGACLDALADHRTTRCTSPTSRRTDRGAFPPHLGVARHRTSPGHDARRSCRHIQALDVDAMIPQMFCVPGMTTYRALFDELGIPYLGNPPEVMAVGADKVKTRCHRRGRRCRGARGGGAGSRRAAHAAVSRRGEARRRRQLRGGIPGARPGRVRRRRRRWRWHTAAPHWLRHTSSSAEKCGAASSFATASWSACRSRSTRWTPAASRSERRDDKLARTDDGDLYLVAKDRAKAWIVADDDPLTAAGMGRSPALPRGPGLPALQLVRLPDRPRRPALVSRSRALLLVRAQQRHRRHGGRHRHRASPNCSRSGSPN